ncbi:crotonobetainyl-CoA:carnitine CoA-transferase CaiB-like acyl-CoA transferase [Constrictibacter sp. MBR-5]|jgi:crotonobetainyl-CoA:carnitine CoA-transferase CaiB-like acyl-CoA transferase|uniref:CaiB/BaiF CoA transferase family protein n=1 Tax=Constrictibacter sp. MBR-5 TaxID=3156467 RepID=UPI0033985974
MTDEAAATLPHPLTGIRVLDFTRVLAGPYLTMMLADLGAEVIKVENPDGGDDSRAWNPPGLGSESAYFLAINRHKKSVTVDLGTEAGRDLCRELAAKCDILVQNFRVDVMERHGLDYAALSGANPRLIYCSISGYGHDTPYRMNVGYDQIAQGEGGLMYLTGQPEADPVRTGASLADTLTGLHAGMAVLAALRAREVTGRGQHVDMALLDTVVAVSGFLSQGALLTGENPPRSGNSSFLVIPTGVYPCADGLLNLLVGNDRQFRRLCTDVLERPDMAEDARFRTNKDRRAHKAELDEVLKDLFSRRPRDHWIERCRASGVPAGSVRTLTEALAAPEPAARDMIQEVEHPAGSFRTVASPMKLSGTPVRRAGPAPLLGEHTDEVLREVLGCDDARIAALRAAGGVR